ncbi:MAG: hypothetical protein RL732_1338 [Bacteroidota bacterium]
MRFSLPFLIILLCSCSQLIAQDACHSQEYLEQEIRRDPTLKVRLEKAAQVPTTFQRELISGTQSNQSSNLPVIRIPVIVHVLYNKPEQNITDAQVFSQIDALNKEFRKAHADTALIPAAFHDLAADCFIEFTLAKVDPQGYATTGIVRKSTKKYSFGMDDAIKFSSNGGDDAWDNTQYLNIWVGSLISGVVGYSSPLGGPKEKDGVVINYTAFGTVGKLNAPYEKGRTAVHEVGHWLGLKHIWGDQVCGSDGIDDTPQQGSATRGCPSGKISSCTNAAVGIMFNNYMDLTNDACTNMFTYGQRDKMRAAFLPGGSRSALLNSTAVTAIPKPAPDPVVTENLSLHIFPNPAVQSIKIDISRQENLKGTTLTLLNQMGQVVRTVQLNSMVTEIDMRSLADGLYFIRTVSGGRPIRIVKAS